MSYKNFIRQLDKVAFTKDRVEIERNEFFNFYFNYFYNIIVNYFTWSNLPDGIEEDFLEKTLLENGKVAIFEHEDLGLIAQSGTFTSNLNWYNKHTGFLPVNPSNYHFPEIRVAYSKNEFDSLKAKKKVNEKKAKKGKNPFKKSKKDKLSPCVVIPNNSEYRGYIEFISLFCRKLADIEMTIELNRRAQVTPFILLVDESSVLSLSNVFNKIASFEPVVKLNKQKTKAGEIDSKQLDDYIKVFRTDAPYLLDKLHDEKNRVINQLLTFIGINNNPVDKKERLTTSEAISNNGAISANIEVNWKARRNACKLINECFGLEIEVEPAKYLQEFNIEQVYNELGGFNNAS